MEEQERKIGDYISECVNRGSFSVEDMEEVILPLIREAGYVKLADLTREQRYTIWKEVELDGR